MSKGKADISAMFDPAPLSDEVLEAASSRGLLRRARRDVESGLVRLSGWEGGTALTEADGESVHLPGGPISAARCSCPASGLCRHILASIVFIREAEEGTSAPAAVDDVSQAVSETMPEADQQEATSPAATMAEAVARAASEPDVRQEISALGEAAIVKAFGRAACIRAQALVETLDPGDIRIELAGNALRIELATHPAVLYLAGAGPAGMISKSATSERAVLHAAALLVVRGPVDTTAKDAVVAEAPAATAKVAPGLLEETAVLLQDAARQALSKAPAGLEERIADLTLSSRAEAIPRLAAELRTIATMIRRRRERSDAADPADLLVMLARSYALVQALQTRSSDPLLSGVGGEAPRALATTDLIGCGLQVWQTDSGARGVTAYYLSAEGRFFNATLARGAGSDASSSPRGAAVNEPVFGRSLAALAGQSFRLDGGAVGGDGRLQMSRGRAEPDGKGWSTAVEAVDGAVVDDWHTCEARLAERFKPRLSMPPRRAVPLVLRPARLGGVRFDDVAQVGRWPVGDGHGAWLELEIEADEDMDVKLALLAALDARKPPLVVVLAEERGADIVLTPLGFGADSLTLLDLPPQARRSTGQTEQKASLLSRLTKGFSLSGSLRRGGEDNIRFEALARPQSSSMSLVSGGFDGLLALAELGGRMEDADRLQRIEQFGQAIEAAGLVLAGRLVARLAAVPSAARPDCLLRAVYALDLLRRVEPRLPFVRPLD